MNRNTKAISINGKEIQIKIKKNARAKRMTLRMDSVKENLVLVLPKRCSVKKGIEFVNRNTEWVEKAIINLPEKNSFADGMEIPFIGNTYTIKHNPKAKRGVWIEGEEIKVSGQKEHLPRRLKDFLKKEAKKVFFQKADSFAESIGKKINRVTIRDTSSRWGSCSAKGNISLSWRLVFAPEHVINYVIAHEVAHLAEMNHSKDFWKLAESFVPDMETSKKWLKKNGSKLHSYN